MWLSPRTIALASLFVLGCGDSHDPPPDGGAGVDGGRADGGPIVRADACSCDAGIQPEDAGGGLACGLEVCSGGELCCTGCVGEMTCFTGPTCPDIDCPPPVPCTGSSACSAEFFCDFPDDACGPTGVCTPRPDACTEDCPRVCGCDGMEHCNRCIAASNGSDTAHDGPCAAPPGCAAMDARGEGGCFLLLGYAWNGSMCTSLGGCECLGGDCGALFGDEDACRAAYADCPMASP